MWVTEFASTCFLTLVYLPAMFCACLAFLKMNCRPEISVCAVEFDLDGKTLLLLRLFVPPRQLIANSICILPQLILGPTVRIVAAAPWNEFFPSGRTGSHSSAVSAD